MLDQVAALSSNFSSCTSLDKTLGVRLPKTLIEESRWVVAPGAYFSNFLSFLGHFFVNVCLQ